MEQQFENNSQNILAPLQKAASFDGKIEAIIDYLKIGVVKCTVKESINKIPTEKDKYTVTGI